MALNSSYIFPSRYFPSLLQILVPVACCTLIFVCYACVLSSSSTCPVSFYFGYGTLLLWISSFFPIFSTQITCVISCLFAWILVFPSSSLRVTPHHGLYFRPLGRSLRTWPSLSLPTLSRSPALPRLLCCSLGNAGNHGEQVCDIHGSLTVVRYGSCPTKFARLHAEVIIGGGIFLSADRTKCAT